MSAMTENGPMSPENGPRILAAVKWARARRQRDSGGSLAGAAGSAPRPPAGAGPGVEWLGPQVSSRGAAGLHIEPGGTGLGV